MKKQEFQQSKVFSKIAWIAKIDIKKTPGQKDNRLNNLFFL